MPSVLLSPSFVASIIIFATVTAHLIVAIRRLFDEFLYFMDGHEPTLYFSEVGAKTNLAEIAQLEIAALTCDLIIVSNLPTLETQRRLTFVILLRIYRVRAVWNGGYRVIVFPCLTTLGLAATGVGVTYQFSLEGAGTDVYGFDANRRITSNAVFTLYTNFYGTFMIAFRLWSHDRRMRDLPIGGRGVMDVLIIIAESATIYTYVRNSSATHLLTKAVTNIVDRVWTLFFFIAYRFKSLLHSLVISCWPVMSGISFMLILARVGWTRRRQSRQTTTTTSAITVAADTWAPDGATEASGHALVPSWNAASQGVDCDGR
ncbi:hypothetical protein K466DRAFT_596006 [Polyporus arcularius HHB13444]|uniref:Uncharacterized protein n=1 Tax=Polyporus arcularius HHB13444 TaxID=1314778 RepID=A0A5C3PP93_9APHY|nr:hypothetical protein K466DRAFT_596006 [Polyporus arcularius HHB13444]